MQVLCRGICLIFLSDSSYLLESCHPDHFFEVTDFCCFWFMLRWFMWHINVAYYIRTNQSLLPHSSELRIVLKRI